MRKIGVIALFCVLISGAQYVYADCASAGYTIIFVNGIFTSRIDAEKDWESLQDKFGSVVKNQPVTVQLGYNPSHLAGAGDLIQSVAQAFGSTVSDYDLKTILMQIQPQVTTRKILLLGHSQGTFYTNEMYQYLITHGVPKGSIAVYNIATPASYVAGGGGYLTSTNDKVINEIRDAERKGDLRIHLDSMYVLNGNAVSSALRANSTAPKEVGWEEDPHGGHYLGKSYLDGIGDRIVADVERELAALRSGDGDENGACFAAPDKTFTYKATSALFAVGDPIAGDIAAVGKPIVGATNAIAGGAYGALASVVGGIVRLASGSGSQTAAAAVPASAPPQSTARQADLGAPDVQSEADAGTPPAPAALPVASSDDTPPAGPSDPIVESVAAPQPVVPAPTTETAAEPAPPAPVAPPIQAYSMPTFAVASPGFGGGGGGGGGGSARSSTVQTTSPAADPAASAAPAAPSVTLEVDTPIDGAMLATTSMSVSGTADAGATVSVVVGSDTASTTADGAGAWSLTIVLPEGATTLVTTATDDAGDASSADTRSITIDTTPPPAPTAAVEECGASLVTWACMVATTTVTLSWDPVSDAASYATAVNGVVGATTTATSSSVAISTSATTSLSVVAYDAAGNAATSSVLDVAALSQPLIINEIGWGGAGYANSSEFYPDAQWIEIKNRTAYALDLSHVAVKRSDGETISLATGGTLKANWYQTFVDESQQTIPDRDFDDLFGGDASVANFGALSTTSAEQLQLVLRSSAGDQLLDATPLESACSGWCAGSMVTTVGQNIQGLLDLRLPLSMERVLSSGDGTLASSWQTTDSYGPNPLGGASTPWGTPGRENSADLPDAAIYCSSGLLLDSSVAPGPNARLTGDSCAFLMRFITGGVTRYGALYRGDVGSSTELALGNLGRSIVAVNSMKPPRDAVAGEHFFYAIWEYRSYADDGYKFDQYFTKGGTPPHGNYVVLPFVYQPTP